MAGTKKPGGKTTAPKKKQDKKEEFSLISNTTLKALYADLQKGQAAVKKAAGRGVFDALPAGVWMDLGDGDAVVSATPDAAVKLKRKGKPLAAVSAEFGSVLGAALLAKMRKSGKVGVIFGEAGDKEFQDSLGIAKRLDLPLIFVSRSRRVDEQEMARELRAAKKKAKKKSKSAEAEGYLPRIHVDAQDVVAVYRVAHESIDRARRGRGPTWIEGVPFKPEGQRVKTDAVTNMEKYLRGKGLL